MRNEYQWHTDLQLEKTTKEKEDYLREHGFTDAGIDHIKKSNNLDNAYNAYNNIKKLNGEKNVK